MASKHNIYVDIARYDEETNTAYGYATTEALDSFGTIIDLESVKACLPEYMRFANIREMHSLLAAGTTEEATIDDKGLYIAAKVVDPVAQLKCKEGVYRGFSIGAKKDYQVDNRIFLKSITEISLVDRPSNTDCTIDAYRVFGKEQEMEDDVNPTPETDIKRWAGEEISDSQGALNAIQTINWLLGYEQSEADSGAHPEAAEQVASLKAAIAALKKFVASEIKENTEGGSYTYTPEETTLLELADKGADVFRITGAQLQVLLQAPIPAEPVERSGAAISSANMDRLQAIHDHTADMGACCRIDAAARSAGEDDVIRAEADITRIETLEADITRLQGEADTLRAENEALKAEPAPAKGVTRVVSKENDSLKTEIMRNDEDVTDPAEMIKRIHQSGGVIISRI